jgi:hypothetical protein
MLNLDSMSKQKIKYNYQNNYNPLLKTCLSVLRIIREIISGENLLQTAKTSSDIISKKYATGQYHCQLIESHSLMKILGTRYKV